MTELAGGHEPVFLGLSNGEVFDAADPSTWSGDLHPIARGLSHVCRFAGQTMGFYSVAEHSVIVHDLLALWGAGVDLCLAGLVHDAHEAIYGDIPTPLKPAIGEEWHRYAAAFDFELARRLDLDPALFHDRDLKHADSIALHAEAAAITRAPWPRPYELPAGISIAMLEPREAENAWWAKLGEYEPKPRRRAT